MRRVPVDDETNVPRWTVEPFDPGRDLPPSLHHYQDDTDPPDLDSEDTAGG